MSFQTSNVGPNPQIPGHAQEAFLPDQLVGGDLKLVTKSVTFTGATNILRGTVMGLVTAGAVTSSTGTVRASGTLTVAAVPVDGDTVTIQGTVVTFKTANPVGNQVLIGADVNSTANNLAAFLIASSDANLVKMTYSVSGAVVTATANVYGTAGNAYTLVTSGTNVTVSGATLASGAANTGNATIGTISTGASVRPGMYTIVNTDATHANVFNPVGQMLGIATFGTAFKDAEINFTITAGGTPCVAGDTFGLFVAVGAGGYKPCSPTATDGSNVAAAIAVDTVDVTSGDLIGGVYLMGEFNARALIYAAGQTRSNVENSLRARGIFIKDSVSAADPS